MDDDEMTELVDADLDRVDLVKGPANGIAFLVAKSEGVTSATGLEGHELIGEDVTKGEMSTEQIDDLPDDDFAYIEPGGHTDDFGRTVPRSLRHFPVNDAAHVRNALARAGDSPFGAKAMPKIRAAAAKFGVEVAKAAEPDGPRSPAWEEADAERADKIVTMLADLRRMLADATDREAQEAAVDADGDDADNVLDLEAVADALAAAIDIVAGYAVNERAEAQTRQEEATAMADETDETEVAKAADPADETTETAEPEDEGQDEGQPEDEDDAMDPSSMSREELCRCVMTGSPAERDAALREMGMRTMLAGDADAAAEAGETDDEATIPGTDTVVAEAEPVTKSATTSEGTLEHDGEVTVTKADLVAVMERLARLEATPAPGGPLLNGATGVAGLAPREPDPTADYTTVAKAIAAEADPTRKRELESQLAVMKIRDLQAGRVPTQQAPANIDEILARFQTP